MGKEQNTRGNELIVICGNNCMNDKTKISSRRFQESEILWMHVD